MAKDLKQLSKQQKNLILNQVEQALSSDPYGNPQLKGDYAGLRRLGGDIYRVIYAITSTGVLVLRIGHRQDD